MTHRGAARSGSWPVRRSVTPIAAALGTIATGVAAIVLSLLPDRPGVAAPPGASLAGVMLALFVILTPALGALTTVRRSGGRIGWLFILMTFFLVLSFLADGVARHADPTPAVAAFAVVANGLGSFAFAILFVLFQVFPTGRVLPGWRWLPVAVVAATATQALTVIVGPASFTPPIPDLVNPLARPEWRPALDALETATGLVLLVVAVATVAALGLRWRRARGIERQQIKWFAWAAMLVVSLVGASIVTSPWGAISDAFWTLALASLILLPIAATAAILRYRLWDIDRLVSRTVAWTAVTAILAAVFGGLVVGLQALLAPITGANSLAVAASTLVVFALFSPLRRRVQRLVDRRFDRARYDAEQTVAALTARLRDETDLTRIGEEIERAVQQALAPQRVAVWTREP